MNTVEGKGEVHKKLLFWYKCLTLFNIFNYINIFFWDWASSGGFHPTFSLSYVVLPSTFATVKRGQKMCNFRYSLHLQTPVTMTSAYRFLREVEFRLCDEGTAAPDKRGCSHNRGQQKLLEGFPGRWQHDQIISRFHGFGIYKQQWLIFSNVYLNSWLQWPPLVIW